jgi:hypothetical protein
MTLVFFITVRTEPSNPGQGWFGHCTSIILYDAPSQDAADQWAKAFVEDRLLKRHPEQELSELKVLPIHDRLFTSAGDEKIDWPSFAEHANATDNYSDHSIEFHSSMMFIESNARKPTASTETDFTDLESLKKSVRDADRWNWNEKKHFYYVLYHGKRAFIVRAMNMLLAVRPYDKAVMGPPAGDHNVYISTWPGAEQYKA